SGSDDQHVGMPRQLLHPFNPHLLIETIVSFCERTAPCPIAQRSFRFYSDLMPKLSEDAWETRRRRVVVSAWKCFSRQGFQATTMDEIIAETGMSSSSVYRYFASKDDLIASAAEESLTVTKGVLDELKERHPVPGPRQTLTAITEALRRQINQPGYDLSKI